MIVIYYAIEMHPARFPNHDVGRILAYIVLCSNPLEHVNNYRQLELN